MSPESVSSLFPDRPIRPLPKRRIRERLSPDVADAIRYPPAPQTTPPLFSYPYSLKEEDVDVNGGGRDRVPDLGRRNGVGDESDGEDGARRAIFIRQKPDILGGSPPLTPKAEPSRLPIAQPPSTASSADGYDSFENTNNKKKRKIPTAGDSSVNGGHSLGETNGVSGAVILPSSEGHGDGLGAASAPYYGSGTFVSSSQGISGPGRGRYGRVRNGRSPLRALSDSSSNWAGRNGKLRPTPWSVPSTENTGIISTAIANAEKVISQPGQENISLLQQQQQQQQQHQQQQIPKTSPASSQFTFTCDSQVPGSLAWPGSDPKAAALPPVNQNSESHPNYSRATQTSFSASGPAAGSADGQGIAMTSNNPTRGGGSQQGPAPQKKSSSGPTKRELRLAAKKRQEETARQNAINPPKPEDQWVCHFCEYERIYGQKPVALIQSYEKKDREQRLAEEERRRSVERAKARSRKGRKASKLPAKAGAASSQMTGESHQSQSMHNAQSQGTHSEDYYEDELEAEEYDVGDDEMPELHSGSANKPKQPQTSLNRGAGPGGPGGPGGGPECSSPVLKNV